MKMFYDPAPNGAQSSGTQPLSLSELDNLPDTPPVDTPIQGGDGTPKPPDISQVPPVTDTPPEPVEGLNADGTLQDGYEKDADGKVVKKDTPAEPPSTDDEPADDASAKDFYKQVNQITGEEVAVDFGETDPLSPEGVALRDKAIRQDAVQKFEDYLRTTDPRAYAYMLHREAGGSDEEFFAEKTFVLSDEQTFNTSIDIQTSILKQDLLDKGVPAEIVEATIAKYIKDNVLTEKATGAYTVMKKAQEQQMKEIERVQNEQKQQFQNQVTSITNTISKGINDGNLNFIIPEAKKAAFNEYIKQNLRYDNGKFYVVNELGENLKEILESQYFQFVKGDLSALIKKEAKTQTTQRLRTTVNRANNTNPKGADVGNQNKDYVPLGHL